MKRRVPLAMLLSLSLAILLFAGGTVVVPAHSVHAATGDLLCTAAFQFNFTPPLSATQTSAQAAADAAVANCLSLNGNYPHLKSAVVTAEGTATSISGIPCNLLLTIIGTATLTWNTGQISDVSFTINTNPLNGTITLSAAVTAGPLSGDTITAAPVVAHPNVDCALNGLSALTSEVAILVIG